MASRSRRTSAWCSSGPEPDGPTARSGSPAAEPVPVGDALDDLSIEAGRGQGCGPLDEIDDVAVIEPSTGPLVKAIADPQEGFADCFAAITGRDGREIEGEGLLAGLVRQHVGDRRGDALRPVGDLDALALLRRERLPGVGSAPSDEEIDLGKKSSQRALALAIGSMNIRRAFERTQSDMSNSIIGTNNRDLIIWITAARNRVPSPIRVSTILPSSGVRFRASSISSTALAAE
jgi:hypothetical protein